MGLSDTWYRNAIIYGVDVETFMDSNGDGVGDFPGLTSQLPYLANLGVTCLWLTPFFPTPNRDNGYDVADHYGVDPRCGTLGDFIEFMHEARNAGIRVITDLVANHTSDQHPWFQESRQDPDSRFRDFYVWSDEPVPAPDAKIVFPELMDSLWSYDEAAKAYYWRRFYEFEPDLNLANPAVREEIQRVMGFWLELGIVGFRIDAAKYMIRPKGGGVSQLDEPMSLFTEMTRFMRSRRGDAVLIGESDVKPHRLDDFIGDGDRLQMLFNFLLNNYLFLALARSEAEPVVRAMNILPPLPQTGQWVNYLRNLDEIDLEQLTAVEREEVMATFAPEETMRIYGNGIRRRLAPMLGGDHRRIAMAFSLLFSTPGAPLFVYGDEIGMGENLSLQERTAVRAPMQWSDERNAGFSTADPEQLVHPVIADGAFSCRKINVATQRNDPDSLLRRVERLIRARRACPEIAWGNLTNLDTGVAGVLALCHEWRDRALVTLTNLADAPQKISSDVVGYAPGRLEELVSDRQYDFKGDTLELAGYGYRWLRVKRES